jgi:ankyrin repeat protein
LRLIAVFVLALLLPASSALADFYALRDYARSGDTAAVKALLQAGEDPNPPEYEHSYAPIQFAAGNGNAEMTWLLLAAGADPDYRDHNGDRALLWAARNGHLETVKLLLAARSSADSDDDPYGRTPLMEAATYGRTDVVEMLLAARADPHRIEQSGDTALHLAARTDDARLVQMLLDAGANPNVFETILFETPLHQAATWSNPAILQLLLDAGAGTNPRDQDGKTPLFQAAELGLAANVDVLIRAGADIDAADLSGAIPLLAAMARSHGEIGARTQVVNLLAEFTSELDRGFATALGEGFAVAALRLLERGANVDAVDDGGRSALANTVVMPGLTYFNLLLLRGADLEKFGGETLLAAAAAGRTDIARALLDRGIDVDVRDAAGGATPLLLAARSAHVDMVRLLLAAGADKVPVDRLGYGVDKYLEIRPQFIEGLIESRQRSRAYRPTLHLEIDLEEIRVRQDEIRKLLAEN